MKREKPTCSICGKEKEVSYSGNGIQYPVFSCPEHKEEKNIWEEWWEKYSTRGLKKEYWSSKKELPSCIVSYFCHKYNEFYEFPYTIDYSNPIPYKNKEFTMARRIITMFGDDYMQIPNYIKWVFHKRVKSKKYPVNSLGFFASSKFVNEYKAAKAQSEKVKRHTKLPKDFLKWCKENYPKTVEYHETKTYNDLNILVALLENNVAKRDEFAVVDEARKRGVLPENGYNKLEE